MDFFTKKKQIWLNKAHQNLKLLQTAKEAYARLDGSNQLVIFYESDKVNPKVLNALAAQTYKITCYEPYPREFAQCCLDLAKFYQLDIDYTAASFLVERLGHDLFKIDSELKNLSLIFANKKVEASELAEALGSLREDHAFKLEDFLLKKQYAKALQLLDELVKRGGKSSGSFRHTICTLP